LMKAQPLKAGDVPEGAPHDIPIASQNTEPLSPSRENVTDAPAQAKESGSSVEFVGDPGERKGVAHPAPNLLRDMWTNTDPSAGGRQDARQEYSESGGEVQGFCV
jgi:hypothetical protein